MLRGMYHDRILAYCGRSPNLLVRYFVHRVYHNTRHHSRGQQFSEKITGRRNLVRAVGQRSSLAGRTRTHGFTRRPVFTSKSHTTMQNRTYVVCLGCGRRRIHNSHGLCSRCDRRRKRGKPLTKLIHYVDQSERLPEEAAAIARNVEVYAERAALRLDIFTGEPRT